MAGGLGDRLGDGEAGRVDGGRDERVAVEPGAVGDGERELVDLGR